jgi:DNA-binding CsgD family transcriptional regulator
MAPHAATLPPIPRGLTPREAQLLPLLASDDSLPELAVKLGLSRETVRVHAKRIYDKLGARTRVGAIVRWLRPDLVTQKGDARLDPSH